MCGYTEKHKAKTKPNITCSYTPQREITSLDSSLPTVIVPILGTLLFTLLCSLLATSPAALHIHPHPSLPQITPVGLASGRQNRETRGQETREAGIHVCIFSLGWPCPQPEMTAPLGPRRRGQHCPSRVGTSPIPLEPVDVTALLLQHWVPAEFLRCPKPAHTLLISPLVK